MRRLALGLLVLVAFSPSLARAATRTYSTGALHRAIPDDGFLDQSILVRDSGPVSKVVVSLRIEHPADSELTLSLISPGGRTILLSRKRGGSGADYGRGRGCGGPLTVFDSDYGDPIAKGTAPFANFSYEPEQKLSALNSAGAYGRWRLRVSDDAVGNTGVLRCVKLEVNRNVVETRKARKGASKRRSPTANEPTRSIVCACASADQGGSPSTRRSRASTAATARAAGCS